MEILALPAFTDNYIWLWRQGPRAVVVDPGDAQVVLDALDQHQLKLEAILVTHHHHDHTGGVKTLHDQTGCAVFASAKEPLETPHHRVDATTSFELLDQTVQVLEIAGHTAGHVAYYLGDLEHPVLFCGDTLFSAGCGRIFEGTAAQMHASLVLLNQRPSNTKVYCTHEYTLSNLRFAAAVEPDNQAVKQHIARCEQRRAQGWPTLPSTLEVERCINPFLRCQQSSVITSVAHHASLDERSQQDAVAVFTALREWKNNFR